MLKSLFALSQPPDVGEGYNGEEANVVGNDVVRSLVSSLHALAVTNSSIPTVSEEEEGNTELMILLFGGIWGAGMIIMGIISLLEKCGNKDSQISTDKQRKASQTALTIGIGQPSAGMSGGGAGGGNITNREEERTLVELRKTLVSYFEAYFPTTFWKISLTKALQMEFIKHHYLLRILFPDQPYAQPSNRFLDMLWILSIQAISMLLLAHLYDLQLVGDIACTDIDTQDLCDDEASILFDWQQPRCEWLATSQNISQSTNQVISTQYGCVDARDYLSFTAMLAAGCATVFVITFVKPLLHLLFALLYAPFSDRSENGSGTESSPSPSKQFTSVVPIGNESSPLLFDGDTDSSGNGGLEFVRQLPFNLIQLRQESKQQYFEASQGCIRLTHLLTSSASTALTGAGIKGKHATPVGIGVGVGMGGDTHVNSLATTMIVFLKYLNRQRKMLVNESATAVRVFDEEWCIDPATKRIVGLQSYASLEYSDTSAMLPGEVLYREIDVCQRLSRKYRRLYVSSKISANQQLTGSKMKKTTAISDSDDLSIGVELIYLFIQDLLGRDSISARLVSAKVNEDFPVLPVVTSNKIAIRGIVVLCVILINVACVYFALTLSWRQSLSWQWKYVIGSLVQLGVEIVYLDSIEILCVQWCLPAFVPRTSIMRIRYVFEDIIQEVLSRIKQYHQQKPRSAESTGPSSQSGMLDIDESLFIALNAPDFLFVSHNVASYTLSTLESVLIRLYKSYLPGEQFSKKWKSRYDLSLLLGSNSGTGNGVDSDDMLLGDDDDDRDVFSISMIYRRVRDTIRAMTWSSFITPFYQGLSVIPFVVHKILVRLVCMSLTAAMALSWWYAVKDGNNLFMAVFIVGVLVVLAVLLAQYCSYSSSNSKRESSIQEGRPAPIFTVKVNSIHEEEEDDEEDEEEGNDDDEEDDEEGENEVEGESDKEKDIEEGVSIKKKRRSTVKRRRSRRTSGRKSKCEGDDNGSQESSADDSKEGSEKNSTPSPSLKKKNRNSEINDATPTRKTVVVSAEKNKKQKDRSDSDDSDDDSEKVRKSQYSPEKPLLAKQKSLKEKEKEKEKEEEILYYDENESNTRDDSDADDTVSLLSFHLSPSASRSRVNSENNPDITSSSQKGGNAAPAGSARRMSRIRTISGEGGWRISTIVPRVRTSSRQRSRTSSYGSDLSDTSNLDDDFADFDL